MTNEQLQNLRLLVYGDKGNDSSDELLNLLYTNAQSRFLIILNHYQMRNGKADLLDTPDKLRWIIEEVTIKLFNRIGSEGMEQESIEGHSTRYESDMFTEYAPILARYFSTDATDSRQGRVVIY